MNYNACIKGCLLSILHNARKEKNLMKNKTKFAFLTVALSAMMVLGACGKTESSSVSPSESNSVIPSETSQTSEVSSDSASESSEQESSSQSSESSNQSSESSIPTPSTYTVTFKVDGQVVQTSQVEEGGLAVYEGAEPTKAGDVNASKYKFEGWDRDLSLPITADTVFNAVFSAYYDEVAIDDFESYDDTASMIDEGWLALGYTSTGWTDETKAAVSLATNAADGNKALRLDAWQNGVGYKAVKTFKDKEFTQPANALAFKIMVPSTVEIKVLLHATATIQGQIMAPSFTYTIGKPISSEYVDYVVPLADDGWALWGEAGKSIKAVADWSGIDEDDILSYLTKIEFYFAGNDNIGGQSYIGFIDSVKFVTLDNPANTVQEHVQLYSTYTGTVASGNVLRVDIQNNGAATASIIDLEVPQTVNGNVVLESREVTFTSADGGASLLYKGRITNGGQLIKHISATGAFANQVSDMDLLAVQTVDNYESYETDGVAYYQGQTDKNARSGCRGAYYSEYYAGSGSSEWGGGGWQLMGGDGSQLKLKQDPAGAHSGNNYLCLKHAKDKAMRYIQWGLFDGTSEQNSFRGSKFSFWAKSNGWVNQFKLYMYSQTKPTNATKDEKVKSFQFTESEAISDWKHYEIDLNPNLVYYGFVILIEKNYDLSANQAYLYIDDVEVYGANPYAHYEEPIPEPEKDYNLVPSSVYYAKYNEYLKMTLNITSLSDVTLTIPGLSQQVSGTYTVDEYEITMDFDGVIYKATTNDYKDKLTFKSLSGSGVAASVLNNASFDLEIGDNAETYTEDGKMYYSGNTNEALMSGARGAYFCDYYSGGGSDPVGGDGWSLMGGSGDQLQLDKTNAYQGSQSLKIKRNKGMDMRYLQWCLYKGDGQPITGMDKFVVYYKNPTAEAITVRTMVYKISKITPSTQGADNRAGVDFEVPANSGWVRCEVELDPNTTYYGYGFMPMKASGATVTDFINVDYAHYVKAGNESDLNYYVKKGDVLTNAYTDAIITFGDPGQLTFNYASQGINNVTCSYTMEMVGDKQVMTFTVNGVTIIGEYRFMYNGSLYFCIDEFVNGPLGDLLIMDAFYK